MSGLVRYQVLVRPFRNSIGNKTFYISLQIALNDFVITEKLNLQEAQLSQRDRATLLVVEYFAKSLKLTQGHSKRHC